MNKVSVRWCWEC